MTTYQKTGQDLADASQVSISIPSGVQEPNGLTNSPLPTNAVQAPKIYPAWRQTIADLELAGIEPGQTIDRDWLNASFGISPPQTIADVDKNNHLFRSFFWSFRTELLRKHRLMLRPIAGVGYEVVLPKDHTQRAMRDRGEEINRALAKLADEISFVRVEELDDAGRKANTDAIAKVGVLMGMANKQLGLDTK